MSDHNLSLHDRDFYAWANEQAALLRAGDLSAVDIEHIAEEIENMGKTEKRELISRLSILLLHLLKWQFQPMHQSPSWAATIRIQRRDLARHLVDNPSLKAILPGAIEDAYGDSIIGAGAETGLGEDRFPKSCPWSYSQMMGDDFWPKIQSG